MNVYYILKTQEIVVEKIKPHYDIVFLCVCMCVHVVVSVCVCVWYLLTLFFLKALIQCS